jgi:hypothetical protein
LPVPLEEKIEILVFLASDQDDQTRQKALQTLSGWNGQELQQVLSNPSSPLAVLDFAASHLVGSREDLLDALLQNPKLTDEKRGRILANLASATTATPPSEATKQGTLAPDERETLIQKISRMAAVEKIRLALTGNQESRMILIRDGNKIVSRSVLQSPKITDSELESFASAKNVSEEVLRLIATNRKFIKSYAVMLALVNNPRAPIDITLRLINRLNDKDLKTLAINRNVADVLRNMSDKMIKQKEEAKKVKISHKH